MKYVANKQLATYISLPYGKPWHVALTLEKGAVEQRISSSRTGIGTTLVKAK